MNQPSLFELAETTPTKTNALIIGKQAMNPLSKSQQTFNRLTKKIEKLQDELQQKTKTLNKCLMYYGSDIHPVEEEIVALRKEVTKLLYKFHIDKKLKLGNKRVLKEVIRVQLENILHLDSNEPDEEIKKIYKNIFGVNIEDAEKEDFLDMMDDMKSMFSSVGLDIDFDDIDMKSNEADVARKMKEVEEQMKKIMEEQQTKQSTKKKTKKQLEKEAKEQLMDEARNRNIGSIYKQLVKVLHPDLEQDDEVKAEKEAMMKQLTVAYQAGDLHTLLRLEIQWIHKENSHLDTLSEEKLALYNQLLKEQINELEEEQYQLIHHPKYSHLEGFTNGFSLPSLKILSSEKSKMEEIIASLKKSIQRLKSDNPLAELREVIHISMKQKQFDRGIDFREFFKGHI